MKRNYLLAVTAVLIWSTMAPVGKVLTNQIPSMEVLFISSLLATVFLLAKLLVTGQKKRFLEYQKKQYLQMIGLGFLGMFLYNGLYYFGISRLATQTACILNYLWPIMTVLFSCLILGEKMSLKKAVALALSFVGVVILTVNKDLFSGKISVIGIIACLGAAVSYGLFSVLNKKGNFDQEVAMTVFWAVSSVCSFAIGYPIETWVPLDFGGWIGFIWNGFFVSAVAYLIWAMALQGNQESAKISNIAFASPFLSLVFCAVFLKEEIKITAILALLFIVGGILLQSIDLKKLFAKKKKQNAEEEGL